MSRGCEVEAWTVGEQGLWGGSVDSGEQGCGVEVWTVVSRAAGWKRGQR